MHNTFISQIKEWIQDTLGPMIEMVFSSSEYAGVLLVALVILIIALIQLLRKKPKASGNKQRNPTVSHGGYKNFQGEVWYPDGRRWNQEKQCWECSDFNQSKTQ